MRSAVIAFVLGLLAWVAAAQEAGINTPITRTSIAKYRVEGIHLARVSPSANLEISRQDSSNNIIDTIVIQISGAGQNGCPFTPSQTPTVGGVVTAMVTAAANETGSDTRKLNFRILTYLVTTTACIQGVTLVP